jgi:hypothetical protein
LDGSCLIVSRYKGATICRTRGSVDAELSMVMRSPCSRKSIRGYSRG